MSDNGMEMKIQELVSRLTLEEKIGMIHGAGLFRTEGVPRLGIPPLTLSDGPMGVRHDFPDASWVPVGNTDDYVTYLPSNSALAATWNPEAAHASGQVLGAETRGRGKDVILAPGINIKRSPLCGRNFEYMSEDPYLTWRIAVPLIQGIQESDASACVKHFAMNNQETARIQVEVEIDARALREIYLPAFKKALQEGKSYSLMGAYNRYRGEYCCESKALLNEVVRKEWNYDGMIVSDWGGVHDTKAVMEGGLDLEMSVTTNFDQYCMASPLKEAVEKGEVEESQVDKKAANLLRLMYRLHMLDGQERKPGSYNTPAHREAALAVARESVVLLKNEKGLLPLSQKKVKKVLMIGDNANRLHSCGGGSAEIKALYEISPLMGVKKLLGGNAKVDFVQGYYANDYDQTPADSETNWQADSLENGGGSTAGTADINTSLLAKQAELREEALKKAADGGYDTVIFVGGQNHFQDLEGYDRPNMKLPYAQDLLLDALLDKRPDTIVVMVSGSPVEMPWISKASSLVWHWYAGMEGGTALAEVLFGRVNPSGHLPESFPITHTDCPAHCIGEFAKEDTEKYAEGIFVGYRYYDTKKVPLLFPFGHGLSYTSFQYKNLQIEGAFPEITARLSVTNTGAVNGQEVVQIYAGPNSPHIEWPAKVLCSFAKVSLQPGETKQVTLALDPAAFQYYDEAADDPAKESGFCTESGLYTFHAGRSVADIRLTTEYTI